MFLLTIGIALISADLSASEARIDVPPLAADRAQASRQRRTDLVKSLKAGLEQVKTAEERQKVLKEFRSEMATLTSKSEALKARDERPFSEKMAAMRAAMTSTPEGQARFAELELRMKSMESIRAGLEKLPSARAEQREAILDDMQNEREKLAQAAEAKRNALPIQGQEKKSKVNISSLPAEVQAMQTKAEKRREEISVLKDALDQATTPEQRAQLIRAWQERRIAERAEVHTTSNAR